VVDILLL